MGTIAAADTPHGLVAVIETENEFGKLWAPLELVIPQELLLKVCTTLAGGG